MRKVLIPTDFSENAFNAILYALELLKHDRTDFYLVHAYADEVYENKAINGRALFEEVKAQVDERVRASLAETVTRMHEASPNPKFTIIPKAAFGTLIDVVNDLIEEENIDLVVMGTLGKSNRKDVTFGSQTLQVVKYVKCPVLVIPSNFHDIHPKHFLFPTDYLIPYKRRELKLIDVLIRCFASRLKVMYVSKFENLSFRQEDNKAFFESCFDPMYLDFEHVKGDDVLEAIKTKMTEEPIDMLVMVNTRHSYLESVLYTSKIDTLGLEIKIPFLILQNLPR